MKFFTLIHLEKNEKSLHNNSFVRSFEDQISLYFSCAKQLHESLKPVGIELVVLTNGKEFLEKLNDDSSDIEIVQLDFSLEVPTGVKFFSAHFKIEIYNYLSSLNEDYIGLIDCDIICVNDMPEPLINIINKKLPLYFDITDQVGAGYTTERIIRDKEKLSKRKSIGLWAGGELLAGPPAFFAKLYQEIEPMKASYFNNYDTFCHQGSEMLTSVAIENMILNGEIILDAGSFSIIARFWSPKTLHVQKSINGYLKHFLLHIPSDKKFITYLKKNELKGAAFFSSYRRHLFVKRILENSLKVFKPYVKRVRKKIQK